ncbi:hypothetical protein [Sinomicrobium weinanense]|uniref:Uncharacterized protein n=1 Tax=Sinomicrobium weinanense TaxID=2842200 RepID=A0A926Q3S7_9FLAO|nr:hypothetical protein [Sinomicrobium weinanense]MBC9797873.1 hypothetical protein [Sinomicrobium weinanense]MBU3122227.1 hypothetical protein [Sinomicrobium weinanense]
MDQHNLIKDLLQKFRENTITREEFDKLSSMVDHATKEAEVKYWMMDHLYDMEPSDEDDPEAWDAKSEIQFEELQKKIKDRDKEGKS